MHMENLDSDEDFVQEQQSQVSFAVCCLVLFIRCPSREEGQRMPGALHWLRNLRRQARSVCVCAGVMRAVRINEKWGIEKGVG